MSAYGIGFDRFIVEADEKRNMGVHVNEGIREGLLTALSSIVDKTVSFCTRVSLKSHPNRMGLEGSLGESVASRRPGYFQLSFAISRLKCLFEGQEDALSEGGSEEGSEDNDETVYFCITTDSIYFIEIPSAQTYAKVASIRNVHYRDIEGILFTASDRAILTFQISGKLSEQSSMGSGFSSVSNDIVVWTRQRGLLVQLVKDAWETFYMIDRLSIEELEVKREDSVSPLKSVEFDADPRSSFAVGDMNRLHWFYRKGYWFLAPDDFTDSNSVYKERPFSTYVQSGQEGPKNIERDAHFIARIGRLSETFQDEYEFRAWVYKCAHETARCEMKAIEASEEIKYIRIQDQFFGDENAWEAFRETEFQVGNWPRKVKRNDSDKSRWTRHLVTLCTKKRIICAIGVRREYGPPFLDTVQDSIIVYFDHRRDFIANERSAKKYIKETQKNAWEIVDSFHPDEFHSHNAPVPYHDPLVLRARVNSFKCDTKSFDWIARFLDVYPSVEFIGIPCHSLSFAFCGSLLKRVQSLESFKDDSNIRLIEQLGFIQDPLAIVYRLEAEMQSRSTSEPMSYWKRNISGYFAYCVDKGINNYLPEGISLSISDLCIYASVKSDAIIDDVIDYLLYFTFDPPVDTSLFHKMQIAASHRFSVNEYVLIQVLSSQSETARNYFEMIVGRNVIGGQQRSAVLSGFYAALLTLDHNLELMEVLFQNLQERSNVSEELVPCIIKVMMKGNTFVQQWACETLVYFIRSNSSILNVSSRETLLKYAISKVSSFESPSLLTVALQLLSELSGDIQLTETQFTVNIVNPVYAILTTKYFAQFYDIQTISEVSVLIARLCQDKTERSQHFRIVFLNRKVHLELLKFLKDSHNYLSIAEELATALGCLLFDVQDPRVKDDSQLVDSVQPLLQLSTLTHDSANRKRSIQILRLLRNMSYKGGRVLMKMKELGVDKILKQIEARFRMDGNTKQELKLVQLLRERVQETNQ